MRGAMAVGLPPLTFVFALGGAATPYLPIATGKRPATRTILPLPPATITILDRAERGR